MFVITCIITSMARNSLLCADVPLRNYSLHSSGSGRQSPSPIPLQLYTATLQLSTDFYTMTKDGQTTVVHAHGNNHDNVPPSGAIGIITSVWIVRELGGRWLPPTTIGVKAARIFIRADLTPCCCWNAYTRNSNMGSKFTPDLRVTWQCYGMMPMFPL